ncbi:MAG: hypothetical protein AB1453_02225 [Chloroflexota bacterium]
MNLRAVLAAAALLLALSACDSGTLNAGPTSLPPLDQQTSAAPALTVPSPPIFEVGGLPEKEAILEKMLAPGWDTLWVLGWRWQQGDPPAVQYTNAWLDRNGAGTLLVSEDMDRLVAASQRKDIPIQSEWRTNGDHATRDELPQRIEVAARWQIHPFETLQPFVTALFAPLLPADETWQAVGASQVAGRDALVLQSSRMLLWVDIERGILLRSEIYAASSNRQPVAITQVEEIRFDLPIPARARQIVHQEGYRPTLGERPAGEIASLEGQALTFHYLTRDAANPSGGYWIDVYFDEAFIGTLDIGSAGFYCGRAGDGNHFAFLHQPAGGEETEIHWLDLRQMDPIHRIREIRAASAPVWSPAETKFAVTGFAEGDAERKTWLVLPLSGEVHAAGAGSHAPPAWSDDGAVLFSLDERYQNLFAFDSSGKPVASWRVDAQEWRLLDTGAPLTQAEFERKFPRQGFDYLAKCAEP